MVWFLIVLFAAGIILTWSDRVGQFLLQRPVLRIILFEISVLLYFRLSDHRWPSPIPCGVAIGAVYWTWHRERSLKARGEAEALASAKPQEGDWPPAPRRPDDPAA